VVLNKEIIHIPTEKCMLITRGVKSDVNLVNLLATECRIQYIEVIGAYHCYSSMRIKRMIQRADLITKYDYDLETF
jgi:hypothetical protein